MRRDRNRMLPDHAANLRTSPLWLHYLKAACRVNKNNRVRGTKKLHRVVRFHALSPPENCIIPNLKFNASVIPGRRQVGMPS